MKQKRRRTTKPKGERPKAKERFATERDLVRAFVDRLPGANSTIRVVHTELESENGIADVVMVRMRKNWVRSSGLAKIPPQWAFALRALPYRKVFTTDAFSELTGASRNTSRSVLSTFETTGFCRRAKLPNSWIKVRQPVPVATQITAIEAKLSDWRRALAQAYRYQDFATESWVLLDAANAGPAIKNVVEFKRLNVGLAALGPDTRTKKIFVPSKHEPKSPIRHWGVLSSIGRRTL